MTMPVLFVGHGSPMNAIEDNAWSRAWRGLGESLPRPRSVLAVSAHWWTRGTRVTAQAVPETIHDFGGFPQELFEVQYPAPGAPDLARRVAELAPEATVVEDWGLDHGTWSVLVHLLPEADVPVAQLSLDAGLGPAEFASLGRKLSALRDEGVLILGSGSVTHNLQDAFARLRGARSGPADWAGRFDAETARATDARDEAALFALHATPDGRIAHPAPDHWFPYLVAWGATTERDAVSWPVEGMDMGSMSMRSARWDRQG